MSRLVQRSPPSTPNPDFQIGPFQGKSLIFFCPPNPNYPHVQRHLSLKTTPTCRTQLQLSNRKREREREIEIEIDRYRERKFTDEHREISHYYYYKLHRKYQTKGFSKPQSLSHSSSAFLISPSSSRYTLIYVLCVFEVILIFAIAKFIGSLSMFVWI